MINKHILLAALVIILSAVAMTGCANSLFYYPDQKIYHLPSKKNIQYKDVYFQSKDGTKLHGWFLPAVGDPVGTVIHFHGNAQNITAHSAFIDWLPEMGFNVFTFDYRGFGKSEGDPHRQGLYEDCIAALKYIKTRADIDQDRLFVFGQSLGGSNVLAVLGKNRFEGIQAVAIDSSFYSYRKIVREKMGNIPVVCLFQWPLSYLVVSNKHSPGKTIDRISPIPLLFIHGTHDRVVPFQHAKRFYKKAREPKYLWVVKGGGHIQGFSEHNTYNRKKLAEFFKEQLK